MTPEEINRQIHTTYRHMRIGLVALALFIPTGLLIAGWWLGYKPEASISAYYFAQLNNTDYVFPLRTLFVGGLWAIGAFLVLYRGFSKTEDRFLTIAGLAAFFVALFPMAPSTDCVHCAIDGYRGYYLHFAAAITLFICLAIVAWACTDETLVTLPQEQIDRFRMGYSFLALAMIIGMPLVFLMMYRPGKVTAALFWTEATGIIAFALYWALKSVELDYFQTQEKKLKANHPFNAQIPNPASLQPTSALGKASAKIDAARHWTGKVLG
jgi:hypothetical protein